MLILGDLGYWVDFRDCHAKSLCFVAFLFSIVISVQDRHAANRVGRRGRSGAVRPSREQPNVVRAATPGAEVPGRRTVHIRSILLPRAVHEQIGCDYQLTNLSILSSVRQIFTVCDNFEQTGEKGLPGPIARDVAWRSVEDIPETIPEGVVLRYLTDCADHALRARECYLYLDVTNSI